VATEHLTKHHAVKTYGIVEIQLTILNLGIRWRCFTSLWYYARVNSPPYPLYKTLGGPRAGLDVMMPWGRLSLLTEMSTRNLPGRKGRSASKADNPSVICEPTVYRKCDSLIISQPYGPIQTVTGIIILFFPWGIESRLLSHLVCILVAIPTELSLPASHCGVHIWKF
jgi:hypothetical protein